MSYTRADLDSVRRAQLELMQGKRVTRVTHNGRSVEYAATDMATLRELESRIQSELFAEEARLRGLVKSRTRYYSTGKGF
ncbi:gpW family head-tail joining protein [Carnimonas bestiolae]|uniref:gpW family head-tail joining protein n=1 Tax=Carnimonas bestiolae TaxID=3402172 RepID=UPI003EDC783B